MRSKKLGSEAAAFTCRVTIVRGWIARCEPNTDIGGLSASTPAEEIAECDGIGHLVLR